MLASVLLQCLSLLRRTPRADASLTPLRTLQVSALATRRSDPPYVIVTRALRAAAASVADVGSARTAGYRAGWQAGAPQVAAPSALGTAAAAPVHAAPVQAAMRLLAPHLAALAQPDAAGLVHPVYSPSLREALDGVADKVGACLCRRW